MAMEEQAIESTRPREKRRSFRWIVDAAFSLQCKGIVCIALLLLTVTAAVAGYLLDTSIKLARRHQEEDVTQLASILAKAVSTHLADGDLESLQALAEKTANGAPLVYAVVVDLQGHCLANATHRSIRGLPDLQVDPTERSRVLGAPVFRSATSTSPAILDITSPVTARIALGDGPAQRTELIGYVRTGVVANIWYRSLLGRIDLMVGFGALVAVVAIPLGFMLIRRIVSPLEDLTLAMLRFSQGELHIRSPVQRRDEIGRLAAAFNRMADKHQRTHERIVRLNARLEERVSQRTQQLRELAAREPLTGLYNRRHFNEVLERRLVEAVRYDQDLAILMIDLDNFKQVNDQFGHQRGDEVVIAAASTINSQLRGADVAARFGGDEFVLLLPQTNSERAAVLAERIAERFQVELTQRMPGVTTGMSVGVACRRDIPRSTSESLMRAADRALYKAKEAGKGKVVTARESLTPSAI